RWLPREPRRGDRDHSEHGKRDPHGLHATRGWSSSSQMTRQRILVARRECWVVPVPSRPDRPCCEYGLPVHRLLVLYPPPTDPDHFRSYYEETHLKLVAEWPGLRGYSYAFDVAAAAGDSPYFCVFEA